MDFDFDEWTTLYKENPEEFEKRRKSTLTRLLGSVDSESRLALEQALFRADMTSQRAKSLLRRAIDASNLMLESFGKLRDTVGELNQAQNLDHKVVHKPEQADQSISKKSAQVLDFPFKQ